jgi:hypothetical protein
MVGNIVHRSVAEPIFRERLKQLDDQELAAAARTWVWQRDGRTRRIPGTVSASDRSASDARSTASSAKRRTTSWRSSAKTAAADSLERAL